MFDVSRQSRYVSGQELVVGDIIVPWFDKITRIDRIEQYNGQLSYLWDGKARIAYFSDVHSCPEDMKFKGRGMTIEPDTLILVYRQLTSKQFQVEFTHRNELWRTK